MPSQPDPQLIGILLEGRYRVLNLLGSGGMGDVYVGEDTRLKRRCALKILHKDLATDRDNVERFLREAQMIASLDHPNIVDIYSYGEEPSGLVYFAMELLNGEDLDARLKARAARPFTVHDCCVWAIQIAQAVAVVHDAGLIHRDLKVSNVFLAKRRDGEELCKLLDFGIARAIDYSELTRTGVALGTPNYMSPEQAQSSDVDHRSDIYSFGVVLFKLLTGRVPFSGDALQVALQHMNAPPPVPSVVAPGAGISPALDGIVLKAMSKRPGDRFQSMREAEDALMDVLRIEAPELAPAVRSRRPSTHGSVASRPPSVSQSTPQSTVTQQDATTKSTATGAGRTAAQPVTAARNPRWLYAVTAASLFAVAAVLTATLVAPRSSPPAEPLANEPAPPSTPAAVPAEPTKPPQAEPTKPPQAEPTPSGDLPVVPAVPPPVEPVPEPTLQGPTKTEPKKGPVEQPKKAKAPDPMAQITRGAARCRKKFGAEDGPKITIDYAIGIDGKVTRSESSVHDDLGECLADVVAAAQFEPKLVLGRKISL